uniref:Uncharacterized protein n=1 Tax=Salix viminalis TaxID=40686 RepID=A0A6N2LKG8_SALVM
MGYVLRVRLASFFAGAATSSFAGLYILYKDFKVAHDAIFQQAAFKGGGNFLKPRSNRKTPLPYTSTLSVNRIEYTFSEILDREIEIQA